MSNKLLTLHSESVFFAEGRAKESTVYVRVLLSSCGCSRLELSSSELLQLSDLIHLKFRHIERKSAFQNQTRRNVGSDLDINCLTQGDINWFILRRMAACNLHKQFVPRSPQQNAGSDLDPNCLTLDDINWSILEG